MKNIIMISRKYKIWKTSTLYHSLKMNIRKSFRTFIITSHPFPFYFMQKTYKYYNVKIWTHKSLFHAKLHLFNTFSLYSFLKKWKTFSKRKETIIGRGECFSFRILILNLKNVLEILLFKKCIDFISFPSY